MIYKKNNNWNAFVEENKLFITKGADEIYYVDDATEEEANSFIKAYNSNNIDSLINNHECDELIDKLSKVGVIYKNKLSSTKKIKVFIKYYGTPNIKLNNNIINEISKRNNIIIVDNIDNSDLALFIRINISLKSILEDYSKIKIPHILIDLGYANNISIGPIVYDEVACLGCYVGRIIKNWGDTVPPNEPLVTNKIELVSAFIIDRIDQFRLYGNCPDLINSVWNYNVNTFISEYNKIYKLPWCPHCSNNDDNTKIDLPWEKEFNYD